MRGKQGEEGSALRGGKSAERRKGMRGGETPGRARRGWEGAGRARQGGKIAARTAERGEEISQCSEDEFQLQCPCLAPSSPSNVGCLAPLLQFKNENLYKNSTSNIKEMIL